MQAEKPSKEGSNLGFHYIMILPIALTFRSKNIISFAQIHFSQKVYQVLANHLIEKHKKEKAK